MTIKIKEYLPYIAAFYCEVEGEEYSQRIARSDVMEKFPNSLETHYEEVVGKEFTCDRLIPYINITA